jgi:hypothetical protein
MNDSSPADIIAGLFRWIAKCHNQDTNRYLDFIIEDQSVGAIHRDRTTVFSAYPQVFIVTSSAIRLHPALNTPESRTRAIEKVLKTWREQGILSAWRNEPYRVSAGFHEPPLMLLDRAATSLFGVAKYGVHVNGLTWREGRLCMWVARRSQDSPTFPGQLDQIVAGGLTAGMSARQLMIKECHEEAGIAEELATQAKPVGLVNYCMERGLNQLRDTLFIYDLMLPATFIPRNIDGEVKEFYLWPVEQVMQTVTETTDFKFNCNLVIIDFLIRHGYLTPEMPGYMKLCKALRT